MSEPIEKRDVLNSLAQQLSELRELSENTRIINTQGNKEICVRMMRMIGTLLHGEPSTKLPTRHNK